MEDSTTTADGVGGGERSATTMGDSKEMLGATTTAAESSKVEARAAGAAPKSGAQGPVASEEQAAHPEMPQGMVGCSVRSPAMEEEDWVEEIERGGSRP